MSKLLDPKILMAIKDLNLSAKTTIDGYEWDQQKHHKRARARVQSI